MQHMIKDTVHTANKQCASFEMAVLKFGVVQLACDVDGLMIWLARQGSVTEKACHAVD